jgi:hypothetical protein
VDAAQEHGARLAPQPLVVAAGQIAVDQIPHDKRPLETLGFGYSPYRKGSTVSG